MFPCSVCGPGAAGQDWEDSYHGVDRNESWLRMYGRRVEGEAVRGSGRRFLHVLQGKRERVSLVFR